jgi:hypothetical protein
MYVWSHEVPPLSCSPRRSTLSLTAKEDQSATVFASVFVLVWCGAGVVTANAALLGGNMYGSGCVRCKMRTDTIVYRPFVLYACVCVCVCVCACVLYYRARSFFQSVCVLGYCICPLNIASIVCRLGLSKTMQAIVVAVAFIWACRGMQSCDAVVKPGCGTWFLAVMKPGCGTWFGGYGVPFAVSHATLSCAVSCVQPL